MAISLDERLSVADGHAMGSDIARHHAGLSEKLETLAHETCAPLCVSYVIILKGSERFLDPLIEQKLYELAKYAILNALQNTDTSSITVKLHFSTWSFRLIISDDGHEVVGPILASGPGQASCGFIAINERAKSIGAALRVDSEAGVGTRVEITLEDIQVYVPKMRRLWRLLRRLLPRSLLKD